MCVCDGVCVCVCVWVCLCVSVREREVELSVLLTFLHYLGRKVATNVVSVSKKALKTYLKEKEKASSVLVFFSTF